MYFKRMILTKLNVFNPHVKLQIKIFEIIQYVKVIYIRKHYCISRNAPKVGLPVQVQPEILREIAANTHNFNYLETSMQ